MLRTPARQLIHQPPKLGAPGRPLAVRGLIAGRGPKLQNTDWIAGEGRALFEAIRARGMEGVVAKKRGSRYVPGQRTGAWVKVKVPGYAPDRRDWFERQMLANAGAASGSTGAR